MAVKASVGRISGASFFISRVGRVVVYNEILGENWCPIHLHIFMYQPMVNFGFGSRWFGFL